MKKIIYSCSIALAAAFTSCGELKEDAKEARRNVRDINKRIKELELKKEELWFEEKGLEPTLFWKNGNYTKWGEAISEIAVLKSRRRPLEQLQKLIMRGGE